MNLLSIESKGMLKILKSISPSCNPFRIIIKVSFFLFVISILSNCKSEKIETDWQKQNLNGKVKSIYTRGYNAEEKYGEYVKTEWIRNDDFDIFIHDDYKTIFNTNGFETLSESYYSNGKTFSQSIKTYSSSDKILRENSFSEFYGRTENITNYTYNEEGLLIEKITYKGDGTIESKVGFKYDENEVLIEELNGINTDDETLIKYTYDSESRVIEINSYENSNGKLNSRELSTYNDELLINHKALGVDGALIHSNDYLYAPNGKNVERIFVDYAYRHIVAIEKKKLEFVTSKFTRHSYFNENNDLFKETETDSNKPDELVVNTFQYQYDSKDNWIQKIEFKNGIAKHIYEREIEYYGDTFFGKEIDSIFIKKEANQEVETLKSKTPEGWEKVNISNLGEISVPPSMELRQEGSLISNVTDSAYSLYNSGKIEYKSSEMEYT